MPIHKVDGGYQWGNHGKVYSSRKGAARQAAAAHANGFTGDMPPAFLRALGKMFSTFMNEEANEPDHQAQDSLNAAGVAVRAPSGRMLFLKRSGAGDHAGEWCFPGGTAESGEGPEQTALRELREETGYEASGVKPLNAHSLNGVDFATYLHDADDEFKPKLNNEHTEHRWASLDDLPQPLHPGVKATLEGMAQDSKLSKEEVDYSEGKANDRCKNCVHFQSPDACELVEGDIDPNYWCKKFEMRNSMAHDSALRLALDKNSVRTYDDNGHMHVAEANISKACINPYLGREIDGWEELGLNPTKIYRLLRDPKELQASADSFGGVPLLIKHIPVSADDHPKEDTVGTVGTEVRYEHPYLKAPLVLWDKDGIDAVENDDKRQLSSGYRYRVDMTPGEYEGEPYDGVMRDIKGNHVALVEEGRAGPDVIVGDELPQDMRKDMSKTVALTRKAATALGALTVFLKPKMAQDSMPDLTPFLKGVTHKNFKDKKAGIISGIEKATKGKLAQDASMAGLADLLDALEGVEPAEAGDANPAGGNEPEEEPPADLSKTDIAGEDDDDEMMEKLRGLGLNDQQCAAVMGMLGGGAEDEAASTAANSGEEPGMKPPVREKKDMVSKPAMDAALKAQRKQILAETRAVREAEAAVRPYVGELAVAFDSASEVYKAALEALEVDIDGVHPSAYPAMLKMVPLKNDRGSFAQDSVPEQNHDTYGKMFGSATRIGRA